MSNVTKKQVTFAVIAVVFAAAMIAATVASAGDLAYAKHKKHSSKSISVNNHQNQRSSCTTAGGSGGIFLGGSSINDSCKNDSNSDTSNTGGNA